MTDPLPHSDPSSSPPRMPLWVKVLGIILIIFALLAGIMLLAGGEHGPRRHIPSGSTGSDSVLASVTED